MEWKTLATLAFGLGSLVAGHFLPDVKSYADAVAGLCVGLVFKQPKAWGKRKESYK